MNPHVAIYLIFALIFIVVNVFAFLFFWADKRAAELGERRISESTLLMLAIIGGSPGAIAGQQYWRHKKPGKDGAQSFTGYDKKNIPVRMQWAVDEPARGDLSDFRAYLYRR